MQTIEVNLYEFEELSKEAQERVIDREKNCPYLCEHVLDDGINSLKAYCQHFDVDIKDWSICPLGQSWVKTNADNSNFRGLKLKDCDRDLMPTGLYLDADFFTEFYDKFKETGNALEAFHYGIDNGLNALQRELDHCFDDEYIKEALICRENLYLENGNEPNFAHEYD